MKLFTLLHGKSKKRMHPIMTDELHKCENYRNAREASHVKGWHDIVPAAEKEDVWRQKSCTIGGNRPTTVLKSTGRNRGMAGYIGSNGFNPHT